MPYLSSLERMALKEGRKQGRQEGRQEGEKIGVIQLCERLLKRKETPTEQLARMALDNLTRLAENLQAQLPKQR